MEHVEKLTRRCLVESLCGATGLSRDKGDRLVALVLDHLCLVLAQALKTNQAAELTLRNFGCFRVVSHASRGGWDFRAGRPLTGPPRRRLYFRAARYFRQIIQADEGPGTPAGSPRPPESL